VDFRFDEHGVLMFRDRMCVQDVHELKKSIMDEGVGHRCVGMSQVKVLY